MANKIKTKQLDQVDLSAFVNDLIDGTGAVYTASRALVTNSSGDVVVSSVTSTEVGYLSGVTSAIQTQLDAKLTSTLTSAYVFVGNGTNVATGVAVSGDITITDAGVTTIGANKVTLAQMATMASASLLGRNTSGIGNVEVLSVSTTRTLLGLATTDSPTFTGLTLSATAAFSASNSSGFVVETGYNSNATATAGTWWETYHLNSTQKKTARFGGRQSSVFGGNFGEFVVQVSSSNAFGTDALVVDYAGLTTASGGFFAKSGSAVTCQKVGASDTFGIIYGTPSNLNSAFYVTDTTGIKVKAGAVDQFTFYWNSCFGVGTISPTAQLHAVNSADRVGLLVKGYSSQSANLAEWQNSSGTVLANISSAGYLGIGLGATAASEKIHLKGGDPAIQLTNVATDSWLLQCLESGGSFRLRGNGTDRITVTTSGSIIFGGVARLKGYTVAGLPAGTQGDIAFATDLLAPTFLVAAVGGGAVAGPVFYDGNAWVTF